MGPDEPHALQREVDRLKQHVLELEEHLRRRTAELEAAHDSLLRVERLAFFGQLAGRFSHELRNPLGVIKNSVYYLRMMRGVDPKIAKHYVMIDRQVEAANRIVTALVDFARVKPPAPVAVDLNAVVREYLERTRLSERVAVVLELAEPLPALSADPIQLALLLGNLVTNAIQAMPEGGTLTITTAPTDEGVSLAIADTGVGIEPADRSRIFEPLFTTKPVGLGLGLSVVKNIVAGHGASITVDSAPGQGSRFTVRFVAASAGETGARPPRAAIPP